MKKLKSKNINLGNIKYNSIHYKHQNVGKVIKLIEIRQWQTYSHSLVFLKVPQRQFTILHHIKINY